MPRSLSPPVEIRAPLGDDKHVRMISEGTTHDVIVATAQHQAGSSGRFQVQEPPAARRKGRREGELDGSSDTGRRKTVRGSSDRGATRDGVGLGPGRSYKDPLRADREDGVGRDGGGRKTMGGKKSLKGRSKERPEQRRDSHSRNDHHEITPISTLNGSTGTSHRDAKRIKQLEGIVQKQELELTQLRADWSRLGGLSAQLRQTNLQAEARIDDLQRALADLTSHYQKSQQLLDARTEELSLAQAYMTTADEVSVADVSRAVRQLNEEIFQCAVAVSDEVLARVGDTTEVDAGRVDPGYLREMEEVVCKRWGEGVVKGLGAGVAKEETILLEGVVQHFLASECVGIVSRFYTWESRGEGYLREVWDGIRASYDTSIAKNWLAMTAKQLKSRKYSDKRILEVLRAIMVVSGWRFSEVPKSVRERVGDIVARARKIREMVTEGVLSTEVEVFLPNNGSQFDAKVMEDAYGVGDGATKERGDPMESILCGVGLGVLCSVGKAEGGERRVETVLRPKVLLRSVLEPENKSR